MSKLNLDFYDGNSLFIYSFLKNIDKKTINLLKEVEDFKDLGDKVQKNILSFLDPTKINTISSLDLKEDDEVLEINATFGCITKFLCEKVKHVTALEFAKQNAEIIHERLKDRDNLEIFVGNISNMKFERKFDKIILTDVLEFSSFFFKSINPYKNFLSFLKNYLKPDGMIVLQISNRFGFDSFSGNEDQYTLKNFDKLMDYPKTSLKAFGKKELEKMFNDLGFGYIKFYYPSPSHCKALDILSTETINKFDEFFVKSKNMFYKEIKNRGELEFFANSFMIVAKIEKMPSKELLYSKFTRVRVNTSLVLDTEKDIKYYKKSPLDERAKIYIQKMNEYYNEETERLKSIGVDDVVLCPCKKDGDSLFFDYVQGKTLENNLIEKCQQNPSKTLDLYRDYVIWYRDFIYRLYPDQKIMDFNARDILPNTENHCFKNIACVKNINLDLNGTNIIFNDGKYFVIDYDSICPKYFPLKLMIFVNILNFLVDIKELKALFMDVLDISEQEWECFYMQREYFINSNIDMRDIVLKKEDL